MSQDKYFREELAFLKDQGKEFSEVYPQLSRFLQGRTFDPDVERLLEGFAFLTARLREKVEDEFPEFTHSVINMLWPNYLRPLPSMSIVAFNPDKSLSKQQTISKGTQLDSKAISGSQCHFRTCRDVEIYPLNCAGVSVVHSREESTLRITLRTDNDLSLNDFNLERLRFFLGGNRYSSQMLYLWFNHHLKQIDVEVNGSTVALSSKAISCVGFGLDDSLLPYPTNVYEGYRILQEYLSFPEAFHFFDVLELSHISKFSDVIREFTLVFNFSKTLPNDVQINSESFRLYCAPIINLFSHDADPIYLHGRQPEYRVIPSTRFPKHYEVFSIDSVIGWQDGEGELQGACTEKRIYSSFESFQHEIERIAERKALYYRSRVRNSIRGDGFDSYISFIRGDEVQSINLEETISVALTCTNRLLPIELGIGDICEATASSPPYARFQNITVPTHPLRPNLDGGLLWTLISNLSLNYLSLLSKDALCSVLRAYDFRALVDRQAERIAQQRLNGIQKIDTVPIDKFFQGLPVRGLRSTLYMDQTGFGSEGDLYLFGTVLSHFFALYASINSFHELEIINISNQEKYTWNSQIGMQPLI